MSDYVIRVENLGKKYKIRHQQERQKYVAMRDIIADKASAPLRWLRSKQGAGSTAPAANHNGNSNNIRLNGNGLAHDSVASLPSPVSGYLSSESGPQSSVSGKSSSEDFWALKDVSFEVKPGEVLGIIGRNGAGKSTLLKILSRITKPTEGQVRIRGRVASLLEVGTGFHPELTGRENIFLNGAILGMKREEIKRKFDEIVAFADITNFLDTPVKRYSSGMYVRLAFAVAAHLEPEILVVDEVLAVGDAEFQKKCLGKMRDVSKGGQTVLFVSHNMAAIESLCNRCLLLNRGKKDLDGSSANVIRRYIGLSNASSSGAVEFTAETTERFGPMELAVLQSLQISDRRGNLIRSMRMGDPLRVLLKINFKIAGAAFEIGIAIANGHGVHLHYFISNWEGLDRVEFPGLKTIEVEVPSIYLFPGSYFVSVWVKKQGGSYDDAVHEALEFDVEEASVTPCPAYFARYSQNSQIYAPSRWRFLD